MEFVNDVYNSDVEDGFFGNIERFETNAIVGWVCSSDSVADRCKVSIWLDDVFLCSSRVSISRPDVTSAVLANKSFKVSHDHHGFAFHFEVAQIADALAKLMSQTKEAEKHVAEMRVMVGCSGTSLTQLEANGAILNKPAGVEFQRTVAEWLNFFGLSFDQALLVRRKPVYRTIARQVWGTDEGFEAKIPELFKSSLRPKGACTYESERAEVTRDRLIGRYFDAKFYADSNREELGDISDPLQHYLSKGAQMGLDPHPLFSTRYVRQQVQNIPGLKVEDGDMFAFFLRHYDIHDLDPHPLFSCAWYRAAYGLAENQNPWVDYIEGGWNLGREPNWAFHQKTVTAAIPGYTYSDRSPLEEFILNPALKAVIPHPILPKWWKRPDLKSAEQTHKSLRPSGTPLFDEPHYLDQLDTPVEKDENLLQHYFSQGEQMGVNPNVLFDPIWYRKTYGWVSAYVGPFVHFLTDGERRSLSPSPLFDMRRYVEDNKDILLASVSPFMHFLIQHEREYGRRPCRRFDSDWYHSQAEVGVGHFNAFLQGHSFRAIAPHPALIVGPRARSADMVDLLNCPVDDPRPLPFAIQSVFASPEGDAPQSRGAVMAGIESYEDDLRAIDRARIHALRMDEPISRMYQSFDDGGAERLRLESHAYFTKKYKKKTPPLVSVIMPALNRSTVILKAIHSVLRQSYENLELIVVDDGSTDGTAIVAGSTGDDRVKVISRPPAGVCAARNAGIEIAKGEYLAYLDSDNTWEPYYLLTMISQMEMQKAEMVHSGLRVFTPRGAILYRGDVYDRDAMDRENYIDMNIFVHRRSLIDAGIRFDERLRRCVDWDFIRRSCLQFPPSVYVPIVGCNYLDDDGKLGRITTNELQGDFYRLSVAQGDFTRNVTGSPRQETPSYSMIWPIHRDEEKEAAQKVWYAAQHLRRGKHELVVIANGLSDRMTAQLEAMSRRIDGLVVVHLWRTFNVTPAVMLALRWCQSDKLLLWGSHMAYHQAAIDGFMKDLSAPVEFPLVQNAKGVTAEGMFTLSRDGSSLIEFLPGRLKGQAGYRFTGVGVENGPVALSKAFLEKMGGFDYDYALRLGLREFVVRCWQQGAIKDVVLRADRKLEADRGAQKIGSPENAVKESSYFDQNVRLPIGIMPQVEGVKDVSVGMQRRRIALRDQMVGSVPMAFPTVSRASKSGGLRIQIRCPAPNDETLHHWGDWHYAQSLAAGFWAAGHTPSICLRDDWDAAAPDIDVALHIRGIVDLKPVANALNVVWMISHPLAISPAEIDAMDIVIATSDILAVHLKKSFGITAPVLPQATDAKRFAFHPTPTIPSLTDRLLFVGNSRRQIRPIVMDAVQRNLPLDVYGGDWEFFLPRECVRGKYVGNEEVSAYYRSAHLVLNDHWPTMSQFGIVSNRLFDVVACGGVAISDFVPGLPELFNDHVRVARNADQLEELVKAAPDWLPTDAQRKELSAQILDRHSFVRRAVEILKIVQDY